MPYKSNESLPDNVKSLPERAQTVWRKAFNSAMYSGKYTEEVSFKIAWAAAKKHAGTGK